MADATIANLLAQADAIVKEHADAIGIVEIVDNVLTLLITAGLASFMYIPAKNVGVHFCNRYGVGVICAQVHKLGAAIVRMGFSYAACAQAVCVEDDETKSSAHFTVKMQSGNEGFGKSNIDEIRYGSLGNGHTNKLWLRPSAACLRTKRSSPSTAIWQSRKWWHEARRCKCRLKRASNGL